LCLGYALGLETLLTAWFYLHSSTVIITPLSALAAIIVLLFFNLPRPEGTFMHKTKTVDWVYVPCDCALHTGTDEVNSGVLLIAGSTVALILGLSWGGVQFAWSSAQVLISLIIGAVAMACFFAYEFLVAKNPLVR
jgi:hypothetical protein